MKRKKAAEREYGARAILQRPVAKIASTELLEVYADLLGDIKDRIRQAQNRAALAVNAELVQLYWDIGRIIAARQQQEGWGAAVIPRLSRELSNEFSEVKSFSERNIGRMIAFYREYPKPIDFLRQPAAKLSDASILPQPAAKLQKSKK